MSKLKQLFAFLKEKWWIPLTTAVIVAFSLYPPRKKKIEKIVKKTIEQEQEIIDTHIRYIEEEDRKTMEALSRMGIKVQGIDNEKKRKELEMIEQKKKRIEELSTKSNKELAKLLRKEKML